MSSWLYSRYSNIWDCGDPGLQTVSDADCVRSVGTCTQYTTLATRMTTESRGDGIIVSEFGSNSQSGDSTCIQVYDSQSEDWDIYQEEWHETPPNFLWKARLLLDP